MTPTSQVTSWLAATRDSVALAQSATETQRQLVDLEEATVAFAEVNTSLQASVAAASALRATGWLGRFPPPEVDRQLDELMTKPDSRLLAGVPRNIMAFNDEVRRALIDHWWTYSSTQIGDVKGLLALTDTLAGVDGVADLAERLRTALGHLARTQNDLPSEDSLMQLKTVRQALADLEASLQPESVRDFLTGVARGGAPVRSINEEVTRWLADHAAVDSFKIVAGPPIGNSDG